MPLCKGIKYATDNGVLLHHRQYCFIFALMKNFWKLVGYLKPYKTYAALNIILNVFFNIFSLCTFIYFIPFFDIIFETGSAIDPEQYAIRPDLGLTKESIMGNLYYLVNELIGGLTKKEALMRLIGILILVFFLKSLFRYSAMFFIAPVRNNVIRDVRRDIYTKILALPLSYFSDAKQGDLLARMTVDVQEVEYGIIGSIEVFFKDFLNIF